MNTPLLKIRLCHRIEDQGIPIQAVAQVTLPVQLIRKADRLQRLGKRQRQLAAKQCLVTGDKI